MFVSGDHRVLVSFFPTLQLCWTECRFQFSDFSRAMDCSKICSVCLQKACDALGSYVSTRNRASRVNNNR